MAKVTARTFAARLLASAEQAASIETGTSKPARVSRKVTAKEISVAEPPEYTGSQVIGIRDSLGVSQPVFAEMLGVKPVTLKKWEQDKSPPAGSARRLLQVMEAEPSAVLRAAGASAHHSYALRRGTRSK